MNKILAILRTAAKNLLGRGSMRSYSQFGEDAVIGAIFRKQKRGVYVDIGCYHPVLYSNTYALYKKGWSGVVVDPNKDMGGLFRVFRPRDHFECAAIGKEKAERTYFGYSDGAYNSLSKEQVETLAAKKDIHPTKQYDISVKPLGELLGNHNVNHIDFMNVDVEGFDLDVLQGYDWSVRPKVIAVEDHTFDVLRPSESALVSFLTDKGYVLHAHAGLTLIFREI